MEYMPVEVPAILPARGSLPIQRARKLRLCCLVYRRHHNGKLDRTCSGSKFEADPNGPGRIFKHS
jgi:hypothetical protein